MEAFVVEWLNLLSRWAHMITGIAWIGASFYFVWLDNHLLAPQDAADAGRGVGGEVWSVHGGGFYHAQKYQVAPPALPETLHWFKWEAYTTWISGMFLLALMYWYGAEIYTIDPGVAELSKPAAIAIGIGAIVVGWIVYDLLCKSPWGDNDAALGAVMFVLLTAAAWGFCQLFSGRGAYMHFGAMLGTIMVANVFFVIIPGQRELLEAKREGRDPDPVHGLRGKQRSVHNTYFTLPVLLVMISNHSAMAYGHEYNWLILIALSLAGALIRVYFVARRAGNASPVPAAVAALLLAGVAAAIAPAMSAGGGADDTAAVDFAAVQQVVVERCASCHAPTPTQPGFAAPPKGVVFNDVQDIVTQAQTIHQQTVVTQAMPVGNLTQITDDERALIDRWYAAGAKAD